MNKYSAFFERLMHYANAQGIKNANELASRLEYRAPEKIYRLMRDNKARPGFDILLDLSNLFESLNIGWLMSGKGPMDIQLSTHTPMTDGSNSVANDPQTDYTPNATTPNVSPTAIKNVSPSVSPSGHCEQLLDEKERVIEQQKVSIEVLQEMVELLRAKPK